jgi:ATP synthase protein I
MMIHVVLVQFAAGLVVCAVAGAVGGTPAAITALLAAMACVIPNGLFALNLALLTRRREARAGGPGVAAASPSALPLLLGELCKLLLIMGLLSLLVWGYREVVWLALIVTVGAVLLVQPLALAWPRR